MKPKIVSVKSLQILELPPPSEKEFVFLEVHGQLGSSGQSQRKPEAKIVSPVRVEKKGVFGWLKGFFGK